MGRRITFRLLVAGIAVAALGGAAVAMSGRPGIGHPASRAWTQVWRAPAHGTRPHVKGSGGVSNATTASIVLDDTSGTASSSGSGPAPASATSALSSVSVTTPQQTITTMTRWRIGPVAGGDVWATADNAGTLEVARWNGHGWQGSAVPPSLGLPTLGTIALARPHGTVWLAGRVGGGVRVVSWNGHTYTPVRAPRLALGDCVTTGVSGLVSTPATGTWLAGTAEASGGSVRCGRTIAFIEHWNERAWTPATPPVATGSGLSGLAVTGDGRLWAYGDAGARRALLLTFTRGAWRHVTTAGLTTPIIAAAPDGTGGLWLATASSYAHLSGAAWQAYSLPKSGAGTITSLVWTPGTRTVLVIGRRAGAPTAAKGGLAPSTVLQRLG